eukprot:3184994-Amphidinium_carterae.1
MLLQLQIGERASAVLGARFRWLHNLDAAASGNPELAVEKVNKKTTERKVPLVPEFVQLLRSSLATGLTCGEEQWPHRDQLQGPDDCLFPSRCLKGKCAQGKSMTRRWYLERMKRAADIIRRQRAEQRKQNDLDSPWEGYDLCQLGTHSMKRSLVSIMKDICRSTAVVASVTGTSSATLDRFYDEPTTDRKRKALQQSLSHVWPKITSKPQATKKQQGDQQGDTVRPNKLSPLTHDFLPTKHNDDID